VPQLQGSLAIGRKSAVHGSFAAARVRWTVAGVLILLALAAIAALGDAVPAEARQRAANAHAKLPLAFVPNAGQTAERVRYHAQGAGYGLYFTDEKAVLALHKGDRGHALELRFLGANPNAEIEASDRTSGRVNYLTGSEHHTNLPTYGRLIYRDLWPEIDMVFAGGVGELSYEFRLRPGAEVSDIRLAYAGAHDVSLDAGGALLIDTPLGTLRDAAPQSFQRIDGRRVPVDSRYALAGRSYGFAVGDHDRGKPLLIDPSLSYSTFLGGSDVDGTTDIAVDSAGAAYVSGLTGSTDFPTTAGAFDTTANGDSDAFVTKLDPTGSGLAYSTYLGGTSAEAGQGIAVDATGAAYVAGATTSRDFPTTAGAFDTSYNGGGFDAFVAKLNPAGTDLTYSTYLGGSSIEVGVGIAVDSAGGAYVTGSTTSTDFPTTEGAFDTSFSGREDAFVSKLNPAGSDLAYSTFLGGSSFDGGVGIAVDSAGAAYVTGGSHSADFPTTAGAIDTSFNGVAQDVFVTKLNPAGSGLAYSTYLGGSSIDQGLDIAVDATRAAYVTGQTFSSDFPTTAGAIDTSFNGVEQDVFVTKLNPAGSGLAYSTYLGGPSIDLGLDIAVDSAGGAYLTGLTGSTDFPTTVGAFDISFNRGDADAFVSKLNPPGSELAYSSYLGGSSFDGGQGIAVDPAGAAYVTGGTRSADFPTTAGAIDVSLDGDVDAFVIKITFGAPASTPRCAVTIGGRIVADNGDRATFGGRARSDDVGSVNGHERYRDHGPAEPHRVKSIRILALTCNQAGTRATISGEATIDRSGAHAFTIEVQDLGEPGKGTDAYRILLDTGYDSGVQTLEGGNVRINTP
jgi:hypothetical protein